MAKATFTYEQLNDFYTAAVGWLKAEKRNPETKLGYALQRMMKRARALINEKAEEFNEALEDLRVDLCSEDERHNILRDAQGRYCFTKQAEKDFLAKQRQMTRKLNQTPIEIEPYFATSLEGASLTLLEREAFAGLVIAAAEQVEGETAEIKGGR
jgi:hypothetical protein